MSRRVPERDLAFGKLGFELGNADDPTIKLAPIAVDDAHGDVVNEPVHGDEGHA